MPRKHGIFSDLQLKVLRLRIEKGLSQAEVADMLKTSRENITIIEGRARRNIRLAQETLLAYRLLNCAVKVKVEPGTHLLEIPRILVRNGDEYGIKLKVNFNKIYDEITLKAKECLSGSRVASEFVIAIFRNGEVEVAPADL